MKINIRTSDNIKLTDDLTQYIDEKLNSLSKYTDIENDSTFIEVELSEGEANKAKFRADISITASGKRTHAVGWGDNLNAAIDASKDELSRRLSRENKKKLSILKKTGRKIKNILRFGGE